MGQFLISPYFLQAFNVLDIAAIALLLLISVFVLYQDMAEMAISMRLLVVLCMAAFISGMISHGVTATFAGGATGLTLSLIIYFLGLAFFTKQINIKESTTIIPIGSGDYFLFSTLGLVLGLDQVFTGFILVFLFAGTYIALEFIYHFSLKRRYNRQYIPLSPFVFIGTVVALLL